jgi:signal transduction histidine kinase
MKPIIAIQIIARAILWLFCFSIAIVINNVLDIVPVTYHFYLAAMGLTFGKFLCTLFMGKNELVWDLRELCLYDFVVQCIGLGLHFYWYNLALYTILCNTIFLLVLARLLWPARTADRSAFISWPVLGLVGHFRSRFFPDAFALANGTTRQNAIIYAMLPLAFAIAALLHYFNIKVYFGFLAGIALFFTVINFARLMKFLEVQHYQQIEAAKAAAVAEVTRLSNLALSEANAKLSETNRQLTLAKAEAIRSAEILRDATHDMKHPISSLNLVTEDLFSETDPIKLAELKKKLRYFISSFGEHIDDTIEVAKLETSLIVPTMETLCTRELLFFTWEHLTTISNASFTPLKLCRSGGFASDFAVITDNNLFHRIINNLAINALYHCQRTGPMVPGQRDKKVLLTLRKKGNKCVVAVWDQGPGIPRADGPDGAANFRQFAATIKDRRMAEASTSLHHGLGVNNVRVLCERLGSPMQLRSIVGRGSVFYFEIPLADTAYTTSN